jgi:hypothetical protein
MAVEVDVWTFRSPVEDIDLTGFEVEAEDGEIGKVDKASYERGGSCIVVDTGPWIFGKMVMLPARAIESIDPEEQTIRVDRTKDEISNAPEFDPSGYADQEYRLRLASYYADFYD